MQLELFFDCSSPWAYLGFEQSERLVCELGIERILRPVLVGGIFNAVNTSIYHVRAHVPAKAAWVAKDLNDWCNLTGVEINFPPPVFPVNSVKAMRACLLMGKRGLMEAFARETFSAYWQRGRDISQDAELAEICRAVGVEAAEVLPCLDAPLLKEQLHANGQELIARGGFGVPTFYLGHTDMYFGVDRLEMVGRAVARARSLGKVGVETPSRENPDRLEEGQTAPTSASGVSRAGRTDDTG